MDDCPGFFERRILFRSGAGIAGRRVRSGLGGLGRRRSDTKEVENKDPSPQVKIDVQRVKVHVDEAVGTVVLVQEDGTPGIDVQHFDVNEILAVLQVLLNGRSEDGAGPGADATGRRRDGGLGG